MDVNDLMQWIGNIDNPPIADPEFEEALSFMMEWGECALIKMCGKPFQSLEYMLDSCTIEFLQLLLGV